MNQKLRVYMSTVHTGFKKGDYVSADIDLGIENPIHVLGIFQGYSKKEKNRGWVDHIWDGGRQEWMSTYVPNWKLACPGEVETINRYLKDQGKVWIEGEYRSIPRPGIPKDLKSRLFEAILCSDIEETEKQYLLDGISKIQEGRDIDPTS